MTGRSFPLHLALAATVCGVLAAQSFDVVSVRPDTTGSHGSSQRTNPGHVMAENITASSMIQQAFGVRASQISGAPGWIDTGHFDVQATTGTTKDLNDIELQPYWESMLANRFHMKYHRESKEMQIYSLVQAKGGAKLTASAGEGERSTHLSKSADHVSLTSTHTSMSRLAELLGRRLDRAVLDNTGLTGTYDMKLEWAPDLSADTGAASLFTALQDQLGLKLESARGPVEIIVIDRLETPTEN